MQPLSSAAATLPRELRPFLDLLNQVFEVEKKVAALTEPHSIGRNLNRMKNWFERELTLPASGGQTVTFSFTYRNPFGEAYNETRTDCDASIAGSSAENLFITEVIKPIVWLSVNGQPGNIVQQAVVVVEGKPAVPAATEGDTTNGSRQAEWTQPAPVESNDTAGEQSATPDGNNSDVPVAIVPENIAPTAPDASTSSETPDPAGDTDRSNVNLV